MSKGRMRKSHSETGNRCTHTEQTSPGKYSASVGPSFHFLKWPLTYVDISFRNLQLDPPGHPAPAPLPTHDPDEPSSWWLISGSPMLFENIGFSKTLEPDSDGVRRKLLACAECDLGPLGWCVLGGTNHWIAVDRVGYQVDE